MYILTVDAQFVRYLFQSQLYTITDKPGYGENYVGEVKIHFSIVESLLPETCKDVKIVVYRQENDMNLREPAKASNLSMQFPIAKTVIPKRLLDFKPILKIGMHVLMDRPMDIAVPLLKEAAVTLGIVQMSSYTLHNQRELLSKALKSKPYSEIVYSFHTLTGQTMSLEQLHASPYSVAVAQGLLGLWQAERSDFLVDMTRTLRQELNIYNSEQEVAVIQDGAADAAAEGLGASQFRAAIESIDEIQREALENAELVLQNCLNMQDGRDVINNVIHPEVGGAWLRRSTWKKITAWQYCATNLNVHMLVSKHMTFADIIRSGGSDYDHTSMRNDERAPKYAAAAAAAAADTETKEVGEHLAHASAYGRRPAAATTSGLHLVPTITVGVPAAHELKFGDGGLRKIFGEISDRDQLLRWISALQCPTLVDLQKLMDEHTHEAASLFSGRCSITSRVDLAAVVRRKEEITRRIDVCASQALGCAVTAVRTLCVLAAQARGRYLDVLARSLKIGFMVMFESMLSSQGAEMGMLEDLEIAALWLSLVTIRLVAPPPEGGGATRGSASPSEAPQSDAWQPSFVGRGQGLTCRRDKVSSSNRLFVSRALSKCFCCCFLQSPSLLHQNGRLIVDIEISDSEGRAVREALHAMKDFKPLRTPVLRAAADARIAFNPEPIFRAADLDSQPQVVYATAELYGVAFSQGNVPSLMLRMLMASGGAPLNVYRCCVSLQVSMRCKRSPICLPRARLCGKWR